jgi:hypothetical protein
MVPDRSLLRAAPRFRRLMPTLLVAFALVLRLLLPATPMAMPAGDALAELLAGGGICHGDPETPGKTGDAACPLCPLCAVPAPVLGAAPPAAIGARVAIGTAPYRLRPPSLAPPAAAFSTARPRGPPAASV